MADLVHDLEDGGEAERLAAMEVNEALGYLWPRLDESHAASSEHHRVQLH